MSQAFWTTSLLPVYHVDCCDRWSIIEDFVPPSVEDGRGDCEGDDAHEYRRTDNGCERDGRHTNPIRVRGDWFRMYI